MSNGYEITGEWVVEFGGQVYRARAVNPAGRILAEVRVHAGYEALSDLRRVYGQRGVEAIEQSARDMVANMMERRAEGAEQA